MKNISTTVSSLASIAWLCGACGSSGAPAAVAAEAPASEPVSLVPVVKAAPAVSAAEAPNDVTSHMDRHFEAVRDIERAAVAGNVEAMRERAAWLAEHEPEASVAYKPELDAMRAVARRLSDALDLQAAIPLAAELGAACGSCHTTMTSIASFEFQALPDDTGEIGQRMVRHLWGADRLWEGLVGPSTTLWRLGADVLASDPLPVEEITSDPAAVREVTRLAREVQRLGALARDTADHAARAKIYGELLGTCAACHRYSTSVDQRTEPPEPPEPPQND